MGEIAAIILAIVAVAALRIAWALAFDHEFIALWDRARDDYYRRKAARNR